MLQFPITKIEYYQIEFDSDQMKGTELESFSFWPSFRRGIHGGWENLMGSSWEELSPWNEEILENWFKTQNI